MCVCVQRAPPTIRQAYAKSASFVQLSIPFRFRRLEASVALSK